MVFKIGEGVIRETESGKRLGIGLKGKVVDVSRKTVTLKTEAGSIIRFKKSEVRSLSKKSLTEAKKTVKSVKDKTIRQILREDKKLRRKQDINLFKTISKATIGDIGDIKSFEKKLKRL